MAYIGNSPGVASQRIVTTFTATASQTTFTPTSGYTVGYLDVYHNGVKLINGDDYTASNGSTFVLASGAASGDVVESVAYLPRGLSDGYTKAEADARYMDINEDTLPSQTGNNGKYLTTNGTAASWDAPFEGGVVINESGADVDFRVESDANSNAIFLDAGSSVLHFMGSTYGAANTSTGAYIANSGQLVVKSQGANYFNRTDADGSVIEFYRSTTFVGKISLTTSGTTYTTSSDRRLKDNIETITDGTAKVMAMNPVTHTWKADPEAPAVHGFIAQEMQDVIPEAVTGEDGGDEMMSMDYGRITPVIVAALQDAHKEIKNLKAEIAALKGDK